MRVHFGGTTNINFLSCDFFLFHFAYPFTKCGTDCTMLQGWTYFEARSDQKTKNVLFALLILVPLPPLPFKKKKIRTMQQIRGHFSQNTRLKIITKFLIIFMSPPINSVSKINKSHLLMIFT